MFGISGIYYVRLDSCGESGSLWSERLYDISLPNNQATQMKGRKILWFYFETADNWGAGE